MSEAMRINEDGNVGIGTTSPSTKLHIEGSLKQQNKAYYNTIQSVGTLGTVKWTLQDSNGSNVTTSSTNKVYRVQLVTTGTGTNTGATWLASNVDAAGWSVSIVTANVASGSNYPYMIVDTDGLPKVTTSHPSNYNVSISVEEFDGNNNGTTTGVFGLDEYIAAIGGNVGIGTTNPVYKLDVNGTLHSSNITLADGIYHEGDTNTYINFLSDTIQMATAGSVRAYINSSGNVGIGTTSPGYKLDVAGEVRANNLFRTTDGTNIGLFGSSVFASNVIGIGSSNAVPLVLGTAATERMRIDSSGNVGIGTTSPTHLLTLETASSPGLKIKDTTQGATLLAFSQDSNSHVGTFSSHPLVFDTNSTERMRITSAGNVGIGTTSPSYKLEVQGDFYTNGTNGALTTASSQSNLYLLNLTRTSTSLITAGNVGIGTTSPSQKLEVNGNAIIGGGTLDNPQSWGKILQVQNTGSNGAGISVKDSNNEWNLATYNGVFNISDGIEERIIINSSGNVGIGTTSPDVKLDIEGTGGELLRLRDTDGSYTALTLYNDTANVNSRNWGIYNNGYDYGDFNIVSSTTNTNAPDIINATRLTINKFGNVGIGTTGPVQKLHIVDTNGANIILNSNTGAENNGIWMTEGGVATPYTNGAYVYYDSTNNAFKINTGTSSLSTRFEIARDTGAIKFNSYDSTNNTGTPTYLLGTDASGNIVKTNTVPGSAAGPYLPLAGGTMSGNLELAANTLNFADNGKARFGNSTDLQIYHDGSNSYIKDIGTGALIQLTNSWNLNNAADTQNMITAAESGAVTLFNSGSAKLATTSTGVTVTGAATATTFLGDLNGTINTVTTAVTKANSTNDTTVATTAFVQNLIGTIPAGLVFQGTWNAATNTPTLTSGTGTTGNFYIVSVDGSTNLDGITDWKVGDWAVFVEQGASDQWEKVDNSSVLDGIGTGQTVALWSGSGTSNTLDDSIITQQSPSGVSILSASATTGQNASLSLYGYDTGTSSVKYGNLNIGTDGSFNIGTNDDYIVLNPTNYVKTQAIHIMTDDVFMYRGKHIRFLDGPGDSWNDVLGLTASTDIIQIGAIASFNSNAGEVAFYSANAEKMRLDIDGNFGIGTTDPNAKLHVNTSATTKFIGTNADYVANSTGSGVLITTGASTGNTYSQIYAFQSGNTAYANLVVPGGNVGIGTTNPGARLELSGASGQLLILDDSSATGNPYMSFYQAGTRRSYIQHLDASDLLTFASEYGGIKFMTGTSGTEVEKMRILADGNVGINTTAPTEKLAVTGNIETTETANGVKIGFNVGDSFTLNGANTAHYGLSCGSSTSVPLVLSGYHGVAIATNGLERARILNSNGYFGILNTAPSYALDVTGTIRATGNVIAFSDARAKENIKTIDSALEKVNKLRGVEFNKIGEEKTCIGVIAQEVEEVLPEVVETDDNGMKAVAYGNMVGLLIEAMKEQQKQIDELKAKLESYGS
jgi:hypothetical protein